MANNARAVDTALAEYEKNLITDDKDKALLLVDKATVAEYETIRTRAMALARAGKTSEARELVLGISQLSQVTQQNASSSEELAATAEEMSGQAEQLQVAVSFFRVNGAACTRRPDRLAWRPTR